MCTRAIQWRVSRKSHKKNAGEFQLGLGASSPLNGNLVIKPYNPIAETFLLLKSASSNFDYVIRKKVELVPVYDIVIVESAVGVMDMSEDCWLLNATFLVAIDSKANNNLGGLLTLTLELNNGHDFQASKEIALSCHEEYSEISVTFRVPKVMILVTRYR